MMPTLTTNRLTLRPFSLSDAADTQRLAGDWEVAKTTLRMPHPYENGMAEAWIRKHPERYEMGEIIFAVTRTADGALIGSIAARVDDVNENANLGYWIGKPYWGQGYGTEAAAAVVKYCFETLKLNKVHAEHFTRNPASGRILQKIGMQHEGSRRQHLRSHVQFEDIELYGILRSDYQTLN